jgi:hypothetical protein
MVVEVVAMLAAQLLVEPVEQRQVAIKQTHREEQVAMAD